MRDFTPAAYEELILAIKRAGTAQSFRQWLVAPAARAVILRHDVDRDPARSAEIGDVERRHGVSSTYYFRVKSCSFDERVIGRLAAMGHEIGYHYEVMADAGGDPIRARRLFEDGLARLRALAPVTTCCMHGSPLSPHDNLSFWSHFKLEEFGLLGEPYLSCDFSRLWYFTDTGRRWDSRANLRDRVVSTTPRARFTPELGRMLLESDRSAMIVTHPERWNEGWRWWTSRVKDGAANAAKLAIMRLRTSG